MADETLFIITKHNRSEERHPRRTHAPQRAKGYADTSDVESIASLRSDLSGLTQALEAAFPNADGARCRRPRVPGSCSPALHVELGIRSPDSKQGDRSSLSASQCSEEFVKAVGAREPPIGSPSSDHLVSPANEKESLPTLDEEDVAGDFGAASASRYPRKPMASLGLPPLASRVGSAGYDSVSTSSMQTDASSVSLTSGASDFE